MSKFLPLCAATILITLLVLTGSMARAGVEADYIFVDHLDIYPGDYLDLHIYGVVCLDPYDKIYDYLVSGYNGGTWDGPGIRSSYAAAAGDTTLGILSGAEYLNWDTHFHGLEVESTWNLLQYTLYGDLNFDLSVDDEDTTIFSMNYVPEGWVPVDHWYDGDLNFDGGVSDDDYYLLLNNMGKTIPEPGTGWLLFTAAAAVFGFLKYRSKKARI